jgi:putative ABC transport system ATP-binding protein
MSIFQRLNQERGLTVILVTHEPDVARYARRVVHLRDGEISADEAVAEPLLAAVPEEAAL